VVFKFYKILQVGRGLAPCPKFLKSFNYKNSDWRPAGMKKFRFYYGSALTQTLSKCPKDFLRRMATDTKAQRRPIENKVASHVFGFIKMA